MDDKNQDLDVLVIGAGLIGVMVASQLANHGYRVAVIDAQAIASGATRRAIGIVTPSITGAHARDTLQGFRELIDVALQHGITPLSCNVLHLASKAADTEALKDLYQSLDHATPRMSWETEPRALPAGYDGGIRVLDGVLLDLAVLCVRLLQHPNILVRTDIEVHALEWSRGKMIVLAAGHTVRANAIVLATNSYAGLLSPYLADAVRVVRGVTWSCRALDADLQARLQHAIPMPLMIDNAGLIAAQLPDQPLRISAWRWDQQAEDAARDDDPAMDVRRFLKNSLPELLDFTHQWQSGTTTVTHDGAPLIGQLAGEGRVLYAIGAGRYGSAWAPYMADRIVELVRAA